MEEKIKLQLQLATSMEEGFREEEFYEEIEAPKFVDFTVPNHFCPDDRYWFCSRVGCDQRHEEEMDSEAIYKNFVLRVMAARSPNVRLRKALTRRTTISETKKCPLSAPPKPSKSRLPRLAIASSSIPKKLVLDDEKGANKPPAERPCSTTPKARVKHVAAKYMTSVKKKKPSSPNPNGFRSARNPKRTSGVRVSKNKLVTKALVFKSPKKAPQKAKASELATPITKLCEGMKKMKISQKSTQKCKSVGKVPPSDGPKKLPSHSSSSRKKNDQKMLGSVKSKLDKKDEKKGMMAKDESSDMEIDGKSRAGSLELHSGKMESKVKIEAKSENALTGESGSNEASNGDDQSKKEDGNVADDDIENQNPGMLGEVADNQGKENGSVSDNVNRNLDGGNLSKHNAPVKHKIKTVDKTLKENSAAGLQGVKYRKLKPTNPKPFRLRTDERGILKEATLERKTDSNESATVASENIQGTSNELSENRERKKELDKSLKQNLLRPIKSKYMSTSKIAEPKSDRGPVSCFQKSSKKIRPQNQREMVSQLKSTLEESKPKNVKAKEPRKISKTAANPTSQAPEVTGRKLAAQGRRAASTIPREPNFQNLHKPRSCIKNTA